MNPALSTNRSYTSQFDASLGQIQLFLEKILAPQEPQILWSAMRHGVLNGGKRIRSVLLIETTLACGGTIETALPTACALELIHCYSLIHDDLPCMDNDDLRRGLPTVHKAYSEAMAVLAGDALLAMAFGLIPEHTQGVPDKTLLCVITELSQAASVRGLVNGQVEDINAAQAQPDEALLYRIHSGKTGALFRFSTRAGAMLANQSEQTVTLLGEFGEKLGLAFQIVDDLLDIRASGDILGKTPGKDVEQGKMTFPLVFGVAGTEKVLYSQIIELNGILEMLSETIQTENLQFLVKFVEERAF